MPTGNTTINFGVTHTKSEDRITVTGQAAILATSQVEAWVRAEASADHSADEHMVEALEVRAGNIVPGVGFDIFVHCENSFTYGVWNLSWAWL